MNDDFAKTVKTADAYGSMMWMVADRLKPDEYLLRENEALKSFIHDMNVDSPVIHVFDHDFKCVQSFGDATALQKYLSDHE